MFQNRLGLGGLIFLRFRCFGLLFFDVFLAWSELFDVSVEAAVRFVELNECACVGATDPAGVKVDRECGFGAIFGGEFDDAIPVMRRRRCGGGEIETCVFKDRVAGVDEAAGAGDID